MRALLDTHVFLWFNTDDQVLPPRIKSLLESPACEAWLSIASLWEIAIKITLGRLSISTPFEELFSRHLAENNIQILPISPEHLRRLLLLPYHHRDPFDRLLVAQALEGQLVFISADSVIRAYGVDCIW